MSNSKTLEPRSTNDLASKRRYPQAVHRESRALRETWTLTSFPPFKGVDDFSHCEWPVPVTLHRSSSVGSTASRAGSVGSFTSVAKSLLSRTGTTKATPVEPTVTIDEASSTFTSDIQRESTLSSHLAKELTLENQRCPTPPGSFRHWSTGEPTLLGLEIQKERRERRDLATLSSRRQQGYEDVHSRCSEPYCGLSGTSVGSQSMSDSSSRSSDDSFDTDEEADLSSATKHRMNSRVTKLRAQAEFNKSLLPKRSGVSTVNDVDLLDYETDEHRHLEKQAAVESSRVSQGLMKVSGLLSLRSSAMSGEPDLRTDYQKYLDRRQQEKEKERKARRESTGSNDNQDCE